MPSEQDDRRQPLEKVDDLRGVQRADQVQEAMQQIPAAQREVILLAYFEGCSQSQMAEQLNLPLGTIKTRVRQGMKKFSELLGGVR